MDHDIMAHGDSRGGGGGVQAAFAGRSAFAAEVRVTVRYHETDQMGVAHHSVYPVWFEVARTEFIKAFGYTYGELENDGLMLPVISLSCEFKGYCRYEDVVLVRAWVSALTGARIAFGYDARRLSEARSLRGNGAGDGKGGIAPLVARGETTHAFVDRQLRPVNLRKYKPDVYAAFAEGARHGPSDGQSDGQSHGSSDGPSDGR